MLDTALIDPVDELVCLGHEEDVGAWGGAMAPPIVQTSLFAQDSMAELLTSFAHEESRPIYSRGNNPSVASVEAKLARLERGEACRCFGSGMAAISAVLLSHLSAGDHLLFVNQVYGPALQLAEHLRRFGIEHDVVLSGEEKDVVAKVRDTTRMIWVESPGTLSFRQLDLSMIAVLSKRLGLVSVIDNSWASPLLQKPIEHGMELVVHSATKYIGGHSDVVAGAVIGSKASLEKIFREALLLNGGILAPFDAWLLNRGLRTLPARMRAHHIGAVAVANYLRGHSRVRRVFFPGFCERQASLAQLSGYSGLLSFELDAGGPSAIFGFVDRLQRFRIGVSWGGVESLALTPFRGDNEEALRALGLPVGLVRLSVGLEPVSVLLADLEQALKALP